MDPNLRNDLIVRLSREEGRRNKPYDDDSGKELRQSQTLIGKLTIGVGRNLTDVGLFDDEIDFLLSNDLDRVEIDLDKWFPWWRNLSPNRQVVLVDMCFNLGINGLRQFKNTLAMIETGNYSSAADNMLKSRWAIQVGFRAEDLAKLMRKG